MRPDTVARHEERVRLVLPYIAKRVGTAGDPLSLDELSSVAYTAPEYFHRIFRSVTGEPLNRFVRRLRLEYAAYRLLLTDLSIIDIALDAGYESHAAFTRAFKRHFGCPPAEFRCALRSGTWPLALEAPPPTLSSSSRQKVAFIRHFGPYADVSKTWGRLYDWLAEHGHAPESMEPIGITYDAPEYCLDGDVRYDACVVVPQEFRPMDGLGVQLIPDQETVVAPHRGMQPLLICTYIRMVVEWAMRREPRSLQRLPFYERYLRFPRASTADEVHAELHIGLK